MGQSPSQTRPRRTHEQLTLELAYRFKEKCFTSIEYYSLKDVFKNLADQQGDIRYLKEDTIARFLEIPDILGASPVIFHMVSYLGAFPFLHEAPVVLELAQLIMVVVIMTERYKRVLAKSTDRTKLLFKSLAVYDRKVTEAERAPQSTASENAAAKPNAQFKGFAVDQPGLDDENEGDEEEEGDLVLTAFELLDIDEAARRGDVSTIHEAIIPTDNLRKIIMLLLLIAPLDPQESLSQYSSRVAGHELELLRATAECVLASFVNVETSPGIGYTRFKTVIPVLFPNLFAGFNGLFEHFLFSKDLDFSKHKVENDASHISKTAQPLLPTPGEILNEHTLSQLSLFLPGSSLFRRVRLLYSGNDAGFSMGSLESKIFNWRAPTILLVSGSRLADTPDGGQEASFAASLPTKRFPHGSKSERVTFGVYIREPWKHTHRECFGDSETVLFQLEPIHDVFAASTVNTDYVTFTKPPGNRPCLAFGCPHPKPTQSHRKEGMHALGAVSLLFDESFEFGVFNHDYKSRGGAFHTSIVRKFDFQDRFRIDNLEVWGCGGDDEAKAQAERWAWEEREAEARRKINLGTGDIDADRALLEMAGLVGGNRSGGSMG
ncbi:hypothetical protein TsFJ059_005225 [Trichoderma semiorbis]|uniref:Restriction of telomere capping protein 5 n=1 Tax=Trichoderma semiorbis TaxID=1491008 RepID=A0A9P8HK71_9HYPO|nr:hypothetical protein TsFJ059_005225 [Trichoderma semiorbis]